MKETAARNEKGTPRMFDPDALHGPGLEEKDGEEFPTVSLMSPPRLTGAVPYDRARSPPSACRRSARAWRQPGAPRPTWYLSRWPWEGRPPVVMITMGYSMLEPVGANTKCTKMEFGNRLKSNSLTAKPFNAVFINMSSLDEIDTK